VAVSDRLFTREEVNALIAELTDIMGEAMERHRQAHALGQALEEERRQIQMSGGTRVDQRDWKARAERLDGLGIEVRRGIERIHGLGGTVKGLDLGLVDFPGLVAGQGDEPVNLCWKHGETAVRFWHRFNEGYAQRKPLP
jgi:hypothetical protein